MATKIPDDILEMLYCDVCYKFLSVKPVKVFPGKKIKCGRCSKDEGVVSLYELIADQYYFPCVNRYDGCDILLTSSQAAAHEENCKSKQYICPICKDDERIPTFLMVKHFRERHRKALLKTPFFIVDPRESLQIELWFLYEVKNKLFFINCFLNGSENIFSLNARYLGVCNELEIITQKCSILHYGSNRTATGDTLCLSHNETDNMGLSVSMSSFNQKESITVCFEINISRVLLSNIPLSISAPCDSVMESAQHAAVLNKTVNFVVSENDTRMNASLIDMDLGYSEDDLIKHRMTCLTSLYRKIYSVGSTSDYCIDKNEKKNIFLRCFKCEELVYWVYWGNPRQKCLYTIISNKEIFLTCKSCFNFKKALTKDCLNESIISFYLERFLSFQFFCIWNCNVYSPADDIRKHEITCDKQPCRLCPVKLCVIKGKLHEIEAHFKEHSSEYSLSLESSVKLQLSLSKPIMKQFLVVRNNVFVYVELTWTKPLWHTKFMLCGEKDTFAGMKLKAMAFDNSSELLGLVEQTQILDFHHVDTVEIKCFLEK